MMSSLNSVVIVGASLAGAKAAETLRNQGFEGRIALLGAEPVRPYERPPLSKSYLRGEADFDSAAVHEPDFYEANDIELRTSTKVTAVHTDTCEVELSSGERIAYDRLLITTGAAPRRLTCPGSGLEGVFYLRSVSDSDAIREAIGSPSPLIVIGAGWIGAEVAASARQRGADVTVVDIGTVPLERVLGPEVGSIYRDLHLEHGVEFRFGVGVEAICGNGKVEAVRLGDGSVIPAGKVVVGVGVIPRTGLGEAAGLRVDNGIVTDEYMATSSPGVYAAGDVANAFHPNYGHLVRLEHWSSALNQGPAAAMNMIGKPTVYDKVPYFFSDQYHFGMEYRGLALETDEVVFRGSRSEGEFITFWLREDRVVAAMNVNVWDQGDHLEALISKGQGVDREKLVDVSIDLGLAVRVT
jgi:3-phenylpropionate/trans-cinnamate dioxygenase ferredoxin reductase component